MPTRDGVPPVTVDTSTAMPRHTGQWRTGGTLRPAHWLASRRFVRPVAAYVAVHAAVIAVVWLLLAHSHIGLSTALESGDGGWYAAIAEHGYVSRISYAAPGVPSQMNIAFFPLLPLLMRVISDLTWLAPPGTGFS